MQKPARSTILILIVLLTAFGLRLFRLGAQPLWSDEIYSAAVAQHTLGEVAGWVYRDNHPALYWLILCPVVHLLGDSAFLVRFPSAFMGTVTVALAYAAGRQILASRKAGFFAALWLTVSPIHVVYSQEARMYAPLALFGIASTLFLYRSVSFGGAANWILFGAAAAATAHSHNYGLLLVAAQALWGSSLLLRKREKQLIWGSALSLAAFAVLYGPMVPALLTQTQMSVGSTGIATPHDIGDFLEAFGAGFMGFSTPGLTPGSLISRTTPLSVALTCTLVLLGLLADDPRTDTHPRSLTLSGKWRSLLLGTCLVFPVSFVYGYSTLMQKAVWQVRGFQMALGCFALLVGAGLALLRPRFLRWMVCCALIAVAAVNLHPHYFDRYKSTVPDAVAAMERQLGTQDILFVAPYWDWTPVRYYYRGPADAIGGWKQDDTFHLAGVGTDYTDLIDPRSLHIQSRASQPIIPLNQFEPDAYTRVWTISHWATPQHVLEIFGNDVNVMHYDVETREWREVVYRATSPLALPSAVESSSLYWESGLRLLGHRWWSPPNVGQTTRLTLFWMADRPQESPAYLELQLLDSNGQVATEHRVKMLSLTHGVPMISLGIRSTFPTTAWPVGSVVAQDVALDIPSELAPLRYRLKLRVIDELSHQAVPLAGEATGILDHVYVARPQEPREPRQVAIQHKESVSFGGQIKLLGYDLPEAPPRPGHHLPVWLHWMAEASPSTVYDAQLRLLGSDGRLVSETDLAPPHASFPTSTWKPGDLIQQRFTIPLPPQMDGGWYRLALRVVDPETQESLPGKRPWALHWREWVVIGQARVLPWPLLKDLPPMEHRTEGEFDEAVQLLGYDLAGNSGSGEKLTVTLYWRAQRPLDESYFVFVHLVDEKGTLVAQADSVPANWLRPTPTWRGGEVIIDQHTLNLPSDLPGGTYRLYTGFYASDGQRLPVVAQGQPVPDARLPLEAISRAD